MSALGDLPIVIDYPWWVAASWFGITAFASAGLCLRDEIIDGAFLTMAGLFVTFGLYSGINAATWSARFDDRGISSGNFLGSASIAWNELADVRTAAVWSRKNPVLKVRETEFRSVLGRNVSIPLFDLPSEQVREVAARVLHATAAAPNAEWRNDFLQRAERIDGNGIARARMLPPRGKDEAAPRPGRRADLPVEAQPLLT